MLSSARAVGVLSPWSAGRSVTVERCGRAKLCSSWHPGSKAGTVSGRQGQWHDLVPRSRLHDPPIHTEEHASPGAWLVPYSQGDTVKLNHRAFLYFWLKWGWLKMFLDPQLPSTAVAWGACLGANSSAQLQHPLQGHCCYYRRRGTPKSLQTPSSPAHCFLYSGGLLFPASSSHTSF